MIRKVATIVLCVLMVLAFVGCTESVSVTKVLPTLDNGLGSGKLFLSSSVDGFTLFREYTTSYDAKHWRVTDSKYLNMSAWVSTTDLIVMVEHVHIDCALQSTNPELDGWSVDSMDDKLAVGTQPGFYVTNQYKYQNIFAIEGYSDRLISGWGFYSTSMGWSSITEHRLTERNLTAQGGVYAEKFQIVYDILVRTASEPYFHTYSVIDEFVVPVASQS